MAIECGTRWSRISAYVIESDVVVDLSTDFVMPVQLKSSQLAYLEKDSPLGATREALKKPEGFARNDHQMRITGASRSHVELT